MGLFERWKGRRLRILEEMVVYQLPGKIYKVVMEDAQKYAEDDKKQRELGEEFFLSYDAWFHGASALACNLVSEVKNIKKAWGKGDRERAIALYEVCVQPMISIFLRDIEKEKEHPEEVKRKAREIAISNVLNILGTYSEDKVRDFLNLDIQLRYALDVSEQRGWAFFYYGELFRSKLAEALGFECYINWREQTFPVEHHDTLCFVNKENPYGDLGFDLEEAVVIVALLSGATAVMFHILNDEAYGNGLLKAARDMTIKGV